MAHEQCQRHGICSSQCDTLQPVRPCAGEPLRKLVAGARRERRLRSRKANNANAGVCGERGSGSLLGLCFISPSRIRCFLSTHYRYLYSISTSTSTVPNYTVPPT